MKLCPYCAEEIQDDALRCKHCGSWVSGPSAGSPAAMDPGVKDPGSFLSRRLTRSSTSKMLSGVCGGMAHFVGIDPTLVRILYAATTVFTGICPGVILYVILAVVMPSDESARF